MEVHRSTTIDRAVADVWRWYAEDHVRNHPRWDPDMHLELLTEGPLGVGSRIKRVNTRWGRPVEGEMEVVEFEPERAFGLEIHDENMDMRGRVTLEPEGPERTRLEFTAEVPDLPPEQAEFMTGMMDRSLGNMKTLLESEG